MDDQLLERRASLLNRHDLAMERWPKRSGAAFQDELTAVAQALEDVGRDAVAQGGLEIEISRTWRYAGMAWYDLAGTREQEWLHRAVAAYKESENHLDTYAEPVDSAKLDYCLGRAFLNLADGPDPSVASDAVECFSRSRATARQSAPELIPTIEVDLANAERVAVIRGQVGRYDKQVGALKQALKGDVPADLTRSDIRALFGILQQSFEQEKSKGKMSNLRSETVGTIMDDIERLLARSGSDADRSFVDLATERQALQELMDRMRPLLDSNTEP